MRLTLATYSYLTIQELHQFGQIALNNTGGKCDQSHIAEQTLVYDDWLKECTVLHQTTQTLHQACLNESDVCTMGFECCIQMVNDQLACQIHTTETRVKQNNIQEAEGQREKAALIIAYMQCLQ